MEILAIQSTFIIINDTYGLYQLQKEQEMKYIKANMYDK